jgi:hypothetical protein
MSMSPNPRLSGVTREVTIGGRWTALPDARFVISTIGTSGPRALRRGLCFPSKSADLK